MAFKDGSKQRGGKTYRQHSSLKAFIRERDNHTCQLCTQPGDIVDHIIPYAVSHDSSIGNLRVLCHACNIATRRKPKNRNPFTTLERWYQYLQSELSKP